MKKHKIVCGDNYWSLELPENWKNEFDEDNKGEYIFYPENSDLTLRITPFHAQNENGELAPAENMQNAFLGSVARGMGFEGVDRVNLDNTFFEKLDDFEKLVFQKICTNDDGEEMLWISIGIFKEGELLTYNIFGTDKNECIQSLIYLRTLEFLR